MKNKILKSWDIDYVEIYTPMAKALAYWHVHALGFSLVAKAEFDKRNVTSYVLASNSIRIVLTTTYPTSHNPPDTEVGAYIAQNYCGVKRIALQVQDSVKAIFEESVANGAIPVKYPNIVKDGNGAVEEASIKLYDHSEITFINRTSYKGAFKPGYKAIPAYDIANHLSHFLSIDHIAGEVRINECDFWTKYLTGAIGTSMVQSIQSGNENTTGMILNINQSVDKKLTLVIAEPETYQHPSKVQKNIEMFGPGIHHVAFTTSDLVSTVQYLVKKDVEFVNFPASYYDLLRQTKDFDSIDIDMLQKYGILVDKEGDTYLFQKFVKPISDRPFFIYEIVQRVNGYNGFALKNINVLKKAEEMEIMKAE